MTLLDQHWLGLWLEHLANLATVMHWKHLAILWAKRLVYNSVYCETLMILPSSA
jgi:hypothetical protein